MNAVKNKRGLIIFLIHSKDLLAQAPNDASFFRSLGYVMKTLLANPMTQVIFTSLLKEKHAADAEVQRIANDCYKYFRDVINQLKKDPKYPDKDSSLVEKEKELLQREKGEIYSTEPLVMTAFLVALKTLEHLDSLGLTELTKPWRIEDPASLENWGLFSFSLGFSKT